MAGAIYRVVRDAANGNSIAGNTLIIMWLDSKNARSVQTTLITFKIYSSILCIIYDNLVWQSVDLSVFNLEKNKPQKDCLLSSQWHTDTPDLSQ